MLKCFKARFKHAILIKHKHLLNLARANCLSEEYEIMFTDVTYKLFLYI